MARDIDLRKIDLNLLHVFEAIYATQNISRAGTQLGMSQPTISNALARLRDQFDDPLFIRSDKGVRPSALAENLIGPIRTALIALREALGGGDGFDPATVARAFCLSINEYSVVSALPDLLRRIDAEAPGIRLTLLRQNHTEPYASLLNGEADLALDAFTHAAPGIDLQPLDAIPAAVCIARRGHPAIDGTMTASLYGSLGHISLTQPAPMRAFIETFLLSHGITRRVVCEANTVSDIPALVAATDLIALVPDGFAAIMARRFDLQVLPPPFPSPRMRMYSGILKTRATDPGLRWLRHALTESITAFAANNPSPA